MMSRSVLTPPLPIAFRARQGRHHRVGATMAAFLPGSLVNVGGTAVAVVARAGAPKRDINSVDALKHALQSAKPIV